MTDAQKQQAAFDAVRCPGCGEPIATHPQSACVLFALIDCVRDRGKVGEDELRALHMTCDIDALWYALGPIIDSLEDGDYSTGGDDE